SRAARRARAAAARSPPSDVELEPDRAVVRAADLGLVVGAHQPRHEALVDAEVVDAPADVPLAHAGAVAPPGVVVRLVAELAEAVDPAALEQAVEPDHYTWWSYR